MTKSEYLLPFRGIGQGRHMFPSQTATLVLHHSFFYALGSPPLLPTLTMLIQVQRWLMQPQVWRFVGFGSTAVGLLCYAISSSFNHMFGPWNLFKTFLYSVLSLAICVAILFAKVWQRSHTLRFKAHMACLVLTFTSAYSFFFDNAANKKPDAYSLVSCAAFAVMSLSLSRQTHCGFEVDLLYFFLGARIVQLMKIRLLFGIVGVGFSYSLIILRSYLDTPLENFYGGLQDQHNVVIQVDSLQQYDAASSVLPSIQLQQAQQPPNNASVVISRRFMQELQRANWKALEVLWTRLNEYLRDKDDQIPMALVNDLNFLIDALPSQAVDNLHEKMKFMMARGFEREYLDEYNSWRRVFMEMCFSMLGLKEFSTEDVDEKERIRRWMMGTNVILKIVLPNERRLCNQIFLGFSSFADLSFMQLYREVTTTLIQNFANSFAIERHSLNLLPDILRVFGTLHDLIPECEFESVCSAQCSVSLSTEAVTILKTLGEAIRDFYCQESEAIVPDGTYPITVQVVDPLSGVFEVEDTLQLVKNINL